MICSHRHRFIFIKTNKTASTSVEMGLEPFCGPGDIVTPIWSDKSHGVIERSGRNYRKSLGELCARDVVSLLYRRRRPQKFGNHDAAVVVREKLGTEVWDRYFKFTIVRNPYDRAVSLYYWLTRPLEESCRPTLFDWICSIPAAVNYNWTLYTDNDRVVMDDFIRYEHLAEDLTRIGNSLNLPGDVYRTVAKKPMKTTQRPKSAGYREVMDDQSRELITLLCHKEIAHFGYEF